jgi:hypothetical protein
MPKKMTRKEVQQWIRSVKRSGRKVIQMKMRGIPLKESTPVKITSRGPVPPVDPIVTQAGRKVTWEFNNQSVQDCDVVVHFDQLHDPMKSLEEVWRIPANTSGRNKLRTVKGTVNPGHYKYAIVWRMVDNSSSGTLDPDLEVTDDC